MNLSSTDKVSFTFSRWIHFPPTMSSLSRFNLSAILKVRFWSLLLLMLRNCSAWASFFAKYSAALVALFTFRYFFLESPLFHCSQVFHFTLTALPTVLFHHQVSLCLWQPPLVYPHISSAASSILFSTPAGIV